MTKSREELVKEWRAANFCRGVDGKPMAGGGHHKRLCSHCRCCPVCRAPPFCSDPESHGKRGSKGGKVGKLPVASSTAGKKREYAKDASPRSDASAKSQSQKKKKAKTKSTATKNTKEEGINEERAPKWNLMEAVAKARKQKNEDEEEYNKTREPALPRKLEKVLDAIKASSSNSNEERAELLHGLVIEMALRICNGDKKDASKLMEAALLNRNQSAEEKVHDVKSNISEKNSQGNTGDALPDLCVLETSLVSGLRAYQSHFDQMSKALSDKSLENQQLNEENLKLKGSSEFSSVRDKLEQEKAELEQQLKLLDEKHRRATDALSFQTGELQKEQQRRYKLEEELFHVQQQYQQLTIERQLKLEQKASLHSAGESNNTTSHETYDIDI